MKSREMVTLLSCPKRYELEQLSLKFTNQRIAIFGSALVRLSKALSEKEGWDSIKTVLFQYLDTKYQESWFELNWQKQDTVNEDMKRLERLSLWLENRICGKDVASQVTFKILLKEECYGERVDFLQARADLLMEESDGSVTGIILKQKFPKPYSYGAYKTANKVTHSVELLCLMQGLMEKYPNKNIQVKMISTYSPKDTAQSLAVFNGMEGDNVIGFSKNELEECEHLDPRTLLSIIIKENELDNCRNCHYEDLCKPATIAFVKSNAEEKKTKKDTPHFTQRQQEVIWHKEGPLRVCAGPGSGKTATLAARVEQLLQSGVKPEQILGITFTKKAAKELKGRIEVEKQPYIATLHALAYRILKEYEYLVGKKKLISRVDCMSMLIEVLNNAIAIKNANYRGISMKYGLLNTLIHDFEFINKKGEKAFLEAFPKKDTEGILNIKSVYEQAYRQAGCIVFDELVQLAVDLLKEYPGAREAVQEQFTYILVDEVQDVDCVQAEFIKLITKCPQQNLMICGDADQSIYSFRGGSNQFMLDFLKLYPGSKDIWLNDNFRSSKEIVEVAESLISHNKERIAMQLRAAFFTKRKAIHLDFFQKFQIGKLIADIQKKGYEYGDIAIVARTNKDLNELCDVFESINSQDRLSGLFISYERPKYYLYQDFVFQSMLDLLELLVCGMDKDSALYRILKGLGIKPTKEDKKLSMYEDYQKRNQIYPFFTEEDSRYLTVTENDPEILKAFSRIYRALKLFDLPIKQAVKSIVDSFIDPHIQTSEVLERVLELIDERDIDSPHELWHLFKSMRRFCDETRLFYQSNCNDRIHMLTAHDAKGQEFPVVFVYAIDNFETGNIQEDRRLLYVAMTRAKRVLITAEICRGKSNFLREVKEKMSVMGGMRYA